MKDLVRIVETAYEFDAADESAWVGKVASTLCAELGLEAAFGFSYHVEPNGWVVPRAMVPVNVAPDLMADFFSPPQGGPEEVEANVTRTHLTAGGHMATAALGEHAMERYQVWKDYYDRVLVARGFSDALVLTAIDPTRNGCVVFAPLREAPKLTRPLGLRYHRITAHVAAGFRLHRVLGDGSAPPEEAVLEPSGKVVHASGPAQETRARAALRRAAVAVDRARGSLRRRDPETALATWQGLAAGRWSLVDRFESDGRRYVIAHRNDPDVVDPRALTLTERQVAGLAALGRSNKVIAYELGISVNTVGALLSRAARKLGVKSRADLARMIRLGEDPGK